MIANKKNTCLALYLIFIAAIFLQFSIMASIVSSILVIVALVIAYRQRKKSNDTIFESHFHWIIRTFWIGGTVYLPVLTIAIGIMLYSIAVPIIQTAYDSGVTDPAAIEDLVMQQAGPKLMAYSGIILLPFAIWWLYRCGKGVKLVLEAKPIENVDSWV